MALIGSNNQGKAHYQAMADSAWLHLSISTTRSAKAG